MGHDGSRTTSCPRCIPDFSSFNDCVWLQYHLADTQPNLVSISHLNNLKPLHSSSLTLLDLRYIAMVYLTQSWYGVSRWTRNRSQKYKRCVIISVDPLRDICDRVL